MDSSSFEVLLSQSNVSIDSQSNPLPLYMFWNLWSSIIHVKIEWGLTKKDERVCSQFRKLLFYLNKLRWKNCWLLNATRYTQGLCPTYTQMRRVFGHHISCGWISCHYFQRFRTWSIADNWTVSTPKSISIISSVRPHLNSSSTAVACPENKMERFLFDLPIWLNQPEV